MRHLEPLPQAASPSPKKTKPAASAIPSKLKPVLAAMVLVAGLGYGMTAIWNTLSSDNISQSEQAELVAAFAKLKAIEVEPVAVQDAENALDSMHLQAPQRQQLQAVLSNRAAPPVTGGAKPGINQSDLVWITLWDFAAADGDIVHISAAGYEMDVVLQKSPTRIAVPVDSSRTVKITGVRDGGGGITLGLKTGNGTVSLPVLKTAQTLALPVSF